MLRRDLLKAVPVFVAGAISNPIKLFASSVSREEYSLENAYRDFSNLHYDWIYLVTSKDTILDKNYKSLSGAVKYSRCGSSEKEMLSCNVDWKHLNYVLSVGNYSQFKQWQTSPRYKNSIVHFKDTEDGRYYFGIDKIISSPSTDDMLKIALNKNMLVYDLESSDNRPTSRLDELMLEIQNLNHGGGWQFSTSYWGGNLTKDAVNLGFSGVFCKRYGKPDKKQVYLVKYHRSDEVDYLLGAY